MAPYAFVLSRASAAISKSPRTLVVLLAVLFSPHAHAYLDPGTGSYILQLAAAGILASMFTLRMYWTKVKDWFRSFGKAKSAVPEKKDEPVGPGESQAG